MLKHSNNPSFVTVGNQAKLDQCIALGADGRSIRHEGSFLPAAQAWADSGVDVILDPVGGQYLMDNLAALGIGGRLVLIGLMSGAVTEVNLGFAHDEARPSDWVYLACSADWRKHWSWMVSGAMCGRRSKPV